MGAFFSSVICGSVNRHHQTKTVVGFQLPLLVALRALASLSEYAGNVVYIGAPRYGAAPH